MKSFGPELVFDEHLYGTTSVYTDARWNTPLGNPDKLGILVTVADHTGTATLGVRIEHSADGRNWIDKTGADVVALAMTSGAAPPTPAFGYDSDSKPIMPYVRLKLTLTATIGVRVKIFASGRDQ